jgi:succinate dehydrogenase / fumarate reductase, membrane anchor subunit
MAIGSKRLVVGAHYGVRDFIAQRLTAIVLVAFVLLLIVRLALARTHGTIGYDEWAGLFVPAWMKVCTFLAALALIYHAWIGMRDVWMDYVRPAGIRLGLEFLTILWLVFCAIWAAQILWSV